MFLRKKLAPVHWLGIVTVVSGLAVVGVSDIVFSKTPEGTHTNAEKIAGDALILIGMLFTSFQVEQIFDFVRFVTKNLFFSFLSYRWFMKNVSLENTTFHRFKRSVGKEFSDFVLWVYF